MPGRTLLLRCAAADDMGLILQLLDEAAAWLRTKGTDQWAAPWPNRAGRDSRILAHLRARRTWIAWDGRTAAATITADPVADPYWPQRQLAEPAVYLHRLVVSRTYAGRELGAELLNWAGREARRDHGARWIRLNAWTTNQRLHEYYAGLGFRRCERGIDDGYPSSALFQRAADHIRGTGRFVLAEAPPGG